MCFGFLAPLFAAGAGGGATAGAAGAGAAGTGIGLGKVLSLVGAGVSAYSQIYQGRAAAAGLEAQAKFNERQAAIERQAGAFEADRARDRARRLQGSQVANFAASGVQIDGSPGNIIDDSAAEAELDVQSILYGAERRSENEIFRSNLNRTNAQLERAGSTIGAIAPFIRSATRINWGGLYAGT